MIYNIKKEDIAEFNNNEISNFPKYTSQLINWANGNAQGTRPKVVGQMSELFPDFLNTTQQISIENWKSYYTDKHPEAIEEATTKIYAQIELLRKAMELIDKDLVEKWVEDLIYNKTFNGLYVQKAILAYLAERKGLDYRLATPDEEAKGIDGYVGDKPYSVKSETYKVMDRLPEEIPVTMIYYKKTKSGLKVDVEE